MTWNDIYQAINMKMVDFMNLGEAEFVAKDERGGSMQFYACCKPDGIEVRMFGKKCLIPFEDKMDKGAYKRCICHGIYKIYNFPNDPSVSAADEIEVQENKKKMKKTINEQQLRSIIRISASRLLKEGIADERERAEWDALRKYFGDSQMLDSLYHFLNRDQLYAFVEQMKVNFDASGKPFPMNEGVEGGRQMHLSELTWDVLQQMGLSRVSMNTDESDAMTSIGSEVSLEHAKEKLASKYGDVLITVDPSADWFDQIRIEDPKFQQEHNAYLEEKGRWCRRCGCD